jgi:serine/threonine protein kinase
LSADDFQPVAIIGRGAFGEVRVCRKKDSGEIVAIKKMKKEEMIYKNQVGHVRAERNVLANADIPWIVDLICSFQDDKFLYLVMEYLPGGDLMTLLMKKDILTEEEAKFYMAESVTPTPFMFFNSIDSSSRTSSQNELYSQRFKTRQHPSRSQGAHQTLGLRSVQTSRNRTKIT